HRSSTIQPRTRSGIALTGPPAQITFDAPLPAGSIVSNQALDGPALAQRDSGRCQHATHIGATPTPNGAIDGSSAAHVPQEGSLDREVDDGGDGGDCHNRNEGCCGQA